MLREKQGKSSFLRLFIAATTREPNEKKGEKTNYCKDATPDGNWWISYTGRLPQKPIKSNKCATNPYNTTESNPNTPVLTHTQPPQDEK
ncbi:MAG: hypothetical protein ABSA18_13870 [Dehalococcoidia bacterium]